MITGGTGSFGQALTQYLLQNLHPKKLIVFSRDEYKQFQMSQVFSEDDYSIRYFLGDVRDYERLVKAFNQVDYIIHAAALKQVPALEYNPFEAVKNECFRISKYYQCSHRTKSQKSHCSING